MTRGVGAAETAGEAAVAPVVLDVPLAHQATVPAMPSTSTAPAAMRAMMAGRGDCVSGAPDTTVAIGACEGGAKTWPGACIEAGGGPCCIEGGGGGACADGPVGGRTSPADGGGPPNAGGNGVALGGGVNEGSIIVCGNRAEAGAVGATGADATGGAAATSRMG